MKFEASNAENTVALLNANLLTYTLTAFGNYEEIIRGLEEANKKLIEEVEKLKKQLNIPEPKTKTE